MGEPIEDIKKEFEDGFNKLYNEASVRSTLLLQDDYVKIISEVKEAQELRKSGKPLSSKHYRRLNRYELLDIGEGEKLISKRYSNDEDIKFYVHRDELFDILHSTHINTGHKREKGMEQELKKSYANITREVINMYLGKCKSCQFKKIPKKRQGSNASKYMNCRCQVDLIDMQTEPDGPYNFILNYQDHLTKFIFLRPLKTNRAHEVADHLVDIFCVIGSPFILQSDHGSEFVNSVITELAILWPGLKVVHGRPMQSQTRGSMERSAQSIHTMLTTWVNENNNEKWSEGLRFIQSQINRSFHKGISRSPHQAMFGTRLVNGLGGGNLMKEVLDKLKDEADLERLINTMQNEHNDDILQNRKKTDSKSKQISDDGLCEMNTEDNALGGLLSENEHFLTDSHFMSQSNSKRFCADTNCLCKEQNQTCTSECRGETLTYNNT